MAGLTSSGVKADLSSQIADINDRVVTKSNMNSESQSQDSWNASTVPCKFLDDNAILFEAEKTLKGLAEVFFQGRAVLLDPREPSSEADPQPVSRST